jgi:uncharacterized membrane protein YdjX (TVP38/TMEM64 family)
MHKRFLFSNTFKFLLFLAFLIICLALGRQFAFDIEQLKDFIARFPLIVSGGIFVGLYVGLTSLIWVGPKDVLRIAVALVFGASWSTLFVWIGEMGNLAVMFNLSRRLGRGFIKEKFKVREEDAQRVKAHTNVLGIAALRINPLFPFRALDLSYGLSAVPFKRYFLTALLVSPLRIFWLQAILAGAGTAFLKSPDALIGYLIDHPAVMYYSFGYFALIAVVSGVAIAGKWKRK